MDTTQQEMQICSCMNSATIGYAACLWLEKMWHHKGNSWWYYGNLPFELRNWSSFNRCTAAGYIIGKKDQGESTKKWKLNINKFLKTEHNEKLNL